LQFAIGSQPYVMAVGAADALEHRGVAASDPPAGCRGAGEQQRPAVVEADQLESREPDRERRPADRGLQLGADLLPVSVIGRVGGEEL
jgi:hypothetical protein